MKALLLTNLRDGKGLKVIARSRGIVGEPIEAMNLRPAPATPHHLWRMIDMTERNPTTCSVEGCEKLDYCRSFCSKHYLRWRLNGSTDDPRPTLEQRFWSKVDRRSASECWLWTAGTNGRPGYGLILVSGRKQDLAHRVSYRFSGREIPPGFHVDHLCRVRL